jgi:uncharacterized protein YqeY
MNLIEMINADFMTAYKEKNMNKKNFLGVLKTEVTKETKTPDDMYVIGKIKSMIKNAESTNSLSETELEILNGYLPKQLTEEEIKTFISNIITDNNFSGGKDMGKVMGLLKEGFDGQYDGKMASQLVKTLLN